MRLQILLNFKNDSFAGFETFCKTVVLKMDGIATYAAEKDQVDIVKALLQTYTDAIAAASDGGKQLTVAKKTARKELEVAITDLALLVQVNSKNVESYITGTGFQIRKKPQINNQPLDRPEWKTLRRGTLSGTVEGEVFNFPKGTNEVGVSYSYDGWVTEHNGTYSSGKKFTLKGLDAKKEVEVKLCFLGTMQRKSDLSEPMRVFVL